MDLEDEEDIYAPDETVSEGQTAQVPNGGTSSAPATGKDGDEEEGEEVEEEDSDSVCLTITMLLPYP